MPNSFAYFALLAWPILTAFLFARMPVRHAVLWSLLAGFLLLPMRTSFELPGIPPLDKNSIPSLSVLLLALLIDRKRPRLIPRSSLAIAFMSLLIIGPVFTAMLNRDALVYGPTVRPGLTLYDGLSTAAQGAIQLIPFVLARHYFASPEAHRLILRAILAAGLAYSLLMLFELRMSPQLHNWAYGFFQHSWAQMLRSGGYRPIVFLSHGLEAALFAVIAAGAAAALWRTAPREYRGVGALVLVYWIFVVVLCKTLSAWGYALILLPAILFASPRLQLYIASVLVCIALLFPVLRSAELFPTQTLLSVAESISTDRARSLAYRFDNEDALLEKITERPVFGWGGWGRYEIYDPFSGHDLSVTDGTWIIVFGRGGWVGFLGLFGLLSLPILLLLRRAKNGLPFTSGALAMLLAINMTDLLPNSSLWPITWLIAGALTGYAEGLATAPRTSRRHGGARGRFRISGELAPEPGAAPPAPDVPHQSETPGMARCRRPSLQRGHRGRIGGKQDLARLHAGSSGRRIWSGRSERTHLPE